MGRAGIRRRKPRRRLPPVHTSTFDDTPPVMWPEAGSGFESSPFSPAGRAQAFWRLAGSARRSDRRGARIPLGVVLVLIVTGVILPILIAIGR